MLKKNLTSILEKKNITIAELSRQTNVPKSNLSSWLKGRSPNIDQLDKVARFLGISIEHLVFGRKHKTEEPIMLYRLEVENTCYEIIVRKINN